MFPKCNNFSSMATIADFKTADGKWSSGYAKDGKTYHTKASAVWHAMRQRCGVGGTKKPKSGYSDCSISENFLNFQYFAEWCQPQIAYGREGYELDKDILVLNNRVYSENHCVFIPQELNSFLCVNSGPVSDLPKGVTRCKDKYMARLAAVGYLGVYATPEQASMVYQNARNKELFKWLVRLQSGEFLVDKKVITALIERTATC